MIKELKVEAQDKNCTRRLPNKNESPSYYTELVLHEWNMKFIQSMGLCGNKNLC